MGFITFPKLDVLPWLTHGFIVRQPHIDENIPRNQILARLQKKHGSILKSQGINGDALCLAEQVHGNGVDIANIAGISYAGVDGLVTTKLGLPLGIYVADCSAIFLVETRRPAIGLLHSGRKGTEANIVREGIAQLKAVCGGEMSHIIAIISPCIHRCCYDVDFVETIEMQLAAEGVNEIWRHPDCTGCHCDRYYSYRKEKGHTGRMLAFMMINELS